MSNNLLMKHNIGTKPNEDTAHYGDCHFWLEDDEGNIIDPTPSAMSGKKNYKKFKLSKQKEIYKVWQIRLNLQNKRAIKNKFYTNPQPRCCQFNVYAHWRNHKKLKVIIGSLGFTQPNGKIFWEFG